MKLENQVCSLEQAKRLRALGVMQSPCTFVYNQVSDSTGKYHILEYSGIGAGESGYAALTVAELAIGVSILFDRGEGLPEELQEPDATMTMIFSAPFLGHTMIRLLELGTITADEINSHLQP